MCAQFSVTELDFTNIKASIKDHFKAQSKYNDWNFDGSGLNFLLDVLAYNTHYNAMIAHFSLNETFLDSAQIRGNVVSHAKLLGYTPRSIVASTAKANIVVTTTAASAPTFITLDRGSRFSTIIDSVKYQFVAIDSLEAPRVLVSTVVTAGITVTTYSYTFTNVTLKQGFLKRMLYRVDELTANQRFTIPDSNVDSTTVRVRIKPNAESSNYAVYTQFATLSDIDYNSQIYHLQENAAGLYEVYFGDGVIGKSPVSNNIVELEYIHSDGAAANGAQSLTALDTVATYSNISVTVTTKSAGGAPQETIESIRYNAPLTFLAQNRAVTADDYRAIILKNVGNIEAISVWGGENAVEPDYGKVYIAIKPVGALALTTSEKDNIIQNVLAGKNVVSITPIIVDPAYTYIALDVFFKYNPNLTDLSATALRTVVRNAITAYNNDNLKSFDGVFRYSQFLQDIDKCDPSILNSSARVFMFKDIVPVTTRSNYFELEYSSPIYQTKSDVSVITSTPFLINGIKHYFGDAAIVGSINRRIYIYQIMAGVEVPIGDAGTIYPAEGRIILSGFIPDDTTTIRITVVPSSNDLAPRRNQLLVIDLTEAGTSIIGEIDSIAVAGSGIGSIGYTTQSRQRE